MNRVLMFLILILWPSVGLSAPPVLNFSDLISGPDSGLLDGVGSGVGVGAIVTVWGNNLGSPQGAGKVYFTDNSAVKREAAHVYYWKDADGILPSGPSNLYTTHKMQEIAFSLPDGAAGAGTITVEVGGVESNTLPFTVRAGNIYYISDAGDNTTGTGTFLNPWKSLSYYDTPRGVSAKASVVAGDIIYSLGVIKTTYESIREKAGTEANPLAAVAYPNTVYSVTTTLEGSAITNNYPYGSSYWVISKLSIATEVTGISVGTGWRAVGNEITDTTCANGQGGAISAAFGKGGSTKSFGNYIHDFGCETTGTLHHVFYISNRSKSNVLGTDGVKYSCKVSHTSNSDNQPITGVNWATYWEDASANSGGVAAWASGTNYVNGVIPAFELGWNRLEDNDARNGLHIYDEGICGDYSGTILIHDNFVRNQSGVAVNIGTLFSYQASDCLTMDVDVYNNIIISPGNSPWDAEWYETAGIQIYGNRFTGHVDVRNNTVVGVPTGMEAVGVFGSGYIESYRFGGTWTYQNNIVIDTLDARYEPVITNKPPTTSNHNIWYAGGDGNPASPPSWDTSPIIINPNLGADYIPSVGSPAINAGADTSSVVPRDIFSTVRPYDTFVDIGAGEYAAITPVLVCDSSHLSLCNTENCAAAGGNFCSGVCQEAACPILGQIINWGGYGPVMSVTTAGE